MPHELSREEALEKARELKEFARDLNAKFDAAERRRQRFLRWRRFTSRDRKDFWRIPVWLWAPIVAILVALFALALLGTGVRLAA